MKPNLEKIFEPDTKLVHYGPWLGADAVTLCGMTDWIGSTPGTESDRVVTCRACLGLLRHVYTHRKPRGM